MHALRKNQERESGFTLIELLVVIIVIGILAAIAVPVFLNQRKKANDAAVKADLKSVQVLMEDAVIDLGQYPASIPAHNGTEGVTLRLGGTEELPIEVQRFVWFMDACNAHPDASCSLVSAEQAAQQTYRQYGSLTLVVGTETRWIPPGGYLSSAMTLIGYEPAPGHNRWLFVVPPAGTPLTADTDPHSYCIEGEHVNGTGVFHVSSETGGVREGGC